MSRRILELYEKKNCTTGLFPIGSLHVSSYARDRVTLYEHLTRAGMRTSRIGLSVFGKVSFNNLISPGWAWSKGIVAESNLPSLTKDDFLCPSIPKLREEPFAIESSDDDTFQLVSDPLLGDLRDLDAWIFYQCESSECRRANLETQNFLQSIGIKLY